MAREKGMGNFQQEKSGRWTMRVGIGGKRYCRSTRHYYHENLTALKSAVAAIPTLPLGGDGSFYLW